MDADMAFSIGLFVSVFSVPAVVSALSEGRPPRVAAVIIVISAGLIVWAITQKPGGYPLSEIPETVLSVVARFLY